MKKPFLLQSKTFALGLTILIAGCTRPGSENGITSVVDFQVPKFSSSSKATSLGFTDSLIPAGKKACFAVDVQGPGIGAQGPSVCAPLLGVHQGFVEEGATISMTVSKGDGRIFSLLMLLVETGAACPSMNPTYLTTGNPFSSTFKVGQTAPLSIAQASETVTIDFNYSQSQASIASTSSLTSCTTTTPDTVVAVPDPALHGVLYSSGAVTNAIDVPFDNPGDSLTSPTLESIWKIDFTQTSVTGFGSVDRGSVLASAAEGSFEVPSFFQSFSRKPDTGLYYSIDHGGQIYEITASGATSLSGASCPFITCEVPVWMQSISAGRGTNLYALDHAGNVYQMTAVGPSDLGLIVSPAVAQVIYY